MSLYPLQLNEYVIHLLLAAIDSVVHGSSLSWLIYNALVNLFNALIELLWAVIVPLISSLLPTSTIHHGKTIKV